ncbi:hypothetical protein EVAR_57746_1 [Eumeta japonica]|uniref:Uncharacterized protein n=1 Tax=Eumeta variegata TaxID=151549 RepID=A0A4C1ZWA9_EUMVA|nr:hypothetical protein EVAR_57746_1 [Eumeta japonica]
MADGLSVGSEADHASLRFIQSNLQRSKLATAELLVGASRRKIAVALVRALRGQYWRAQAVPGYQTLIDENVTAAVVTAGNCRIGVVGHFECDKPIGPYLDRVKWVCSKLGTNKIILGATSTHGACGGANENIASRISKYVDVTLQPAHWIERTNRSGPRSQHFGAISNTFNVPPGAVRTEPPGHKNIANTRLEWSDVQRSDKRRKKGL